MKVGYGTLVPVSKPVLIALLWSQKAMEFKFQKKSVRSISGGTQDGKGFHSFPDRSDFVKMGLAEGHMYSVNCATKSVCLR